MSSGFTTVSASHLQDATGTVVNNATIYFAPVSNTGAPIAFRTGGTAGQTISQPVSTTVTNGAFSIVLADTTQTTPVNIGYSVTVIDNLTGQSLLGAGYGCVQPFGSTWSFDNYVPNLAGQVTVQYGPQGVPGTAASVAIGTVTSGSAPSVTNAGTSTAAVLNFILPKGETGATGTPGANAQVGTISGTFARQAYSGDGSTTVFTLPFSGAELLLLNGVALASPADYTVSGTTITTTFVPTATDKLTAIVFPTSQTQAVGLALASPGPIGSTTPSTGTFTSLAFANGADPLTLTPSINNGNQDVLTMTTANSANQLKLKVLGGYYSGLGFGALTDNAEMVYNSDGIAFSINGAELQKATTGGYRMDVPLYISDTVINAFSASGIILTVRSQHGGFLTVDQNGNLATNGSVQATDVLVTGVTPASATDTTTGNIPTASGAIWSDDTYLYRRTSSGTIVKLPWKAF